MDRTAPLFNDVQPFQGWLPLYEHSRDPNSPFHEVEHSLVSYDRYIYNFEAHPLWDDFGSESLLVKILYADYAHGYAILELLGEWNDLFENDFRLLYQHVLLPLNRAGVQRFVFIAENVFNAYLEADDYYDEFFQELEDGWMCLLRARPHVLADFQAWDIGRFFHWSPEFDALRWRKCKPWQVVDLVEASMTRMLR